MSSRGVMSTVTRILADGIPRPICLAMSTVTVRGTKASTRPMASAPASTATSAILRSVTPHTLTQVTAGPLAPAHRRPPLAGEQRHRARRVVVAHQALADQDGVVASRRHPCHVGAAGDPALCHPSLEPIEPAASRSATPRSTSNVTRFRALTPTSRRRGACPLHFHLVVHLDQSSIPASAGGGDEVGEGLVVEGGDDQEEGVGPDCPALPNLGRVDDEVLAEDGHANGRGGSLEVGGAPGEEFRFGEDRDGGRTACLVGGGERCGSRSGASGPRDGERRFISAMTRFRVR